MAVKEELIKIRVALTGAKEAKTELDALATSEQKVATSGTAAAKSIKTVGAAAKTAAAPVAGAAKATSGASAAFVKIGGAGQAAMGAMGGLRSAAGPLTASLAGAATGASGAAAAAAGLGTALGAALGPIGLAVSAVAAIGAALYSAHEAKQEDEKATRAWAREYQQRSRDVIQARDEVIRAHKNQIEISESTAATEMLEYELELLELLGGSKDQIAAKELEIWEARAGELETAGDILRTDRQVARLELERAESALKAAQSEKNRAAAIDDSKTRTEQLRAAEEDILAAQERVTEAIQNQNSVREEGLALTQQQLDLDRKRELELAKAKRSEIDQAKADAVEAYTGAKDTSGAVPIEAIEGIRAQVFAAGGTEADADEAVQDVISGSFAPKPSRGGGKKPKKEEKVEARFGDYLDVLKAYADSRAGVDAKALDSLAKGSMPKDHKPETSITITNHNNWTFENEFAIVGGRPTQAIAVDVAAAIQAEIIKAIKQTPNGLVR